MIKKIQELKIKIDEKMSQDIIMAEISNAPLKVPIDYEKEVFNNPGEHLQMDNVDPSFSRVKGEKMPTKSICGYKDAVIALDN
jgi:hypothetical protein